MDEKWRVIDIADGYEVSNLGRVRSVDRVVTRQDGKSFKFKGRVLKQFKNNSGYPQVTLSFVGSKISPFVHSIVASAFLGQRPVGFDVCHCDGDKGNNCASNLRYDTRRGNMLDCISHGTDSRGSKNGSSVLTDLDVVSIREMVANGSPMREVADKFAISFSQVSLITLGKSWPHVGGPVRPALPNQGSGTRRSKLNEAQVLEIRNKFMVDGASYSSIAREYGVSPAIVSFIIKGKRWAHV